MNRVRASSPEASTRMRGIRQSSTDIELAVRRVATQLGLRYRIKNRELPGSPDLANRRGKWAVFVHGCFWHGHEKCNLATVPKSNSDFWISKLADNRRRDARKARLLAKMGYRVLVIWGCQAENENAVRRKLSLLATKALPPRLPLGRPRRRA